MKNFTTTFFLVSAPALAVLLVGYIQGRVLWFSPHGALGWLLRPICYLVGLGAGLIDAFTRPPGKTDATSDASSDVNTSLSDHCRALNSLYADEVGNSSLKWLGVSVDANA